MASNGDKELLRNPKRGSIRRGTVGGSAFTDRDYSEGFKNRHTKNSVIALSLSPLIIGIVSLWFVGLKLFALILGFAISLISILAFIVTKTSV